MTAIFPEIEYSDVGGGRFVVFLRGEIDLFTAPTLSANLAEVIDERPRTVVVDLSATTFVDSTALGVLLQARNDVVARGGRMILASTSDVVRHVLEQTGLDRHFDVASVRVA